jgi:hypothetical protein
MSFNPQIIELADGLKCVLLEEYKKLERERDEARAELSLKCQSVTIASGTISDLLKKIERFEKQIEGLNNFANERFDEIQRVRRERDEAMRQNAKLRDIAERAQTICERWVSPQYADAGAVKQLRAELDQLMEGAK